MYWRTREKILGLYISLFLSCDEITPQSFHHFGNGWQNQKATRGQNAMGDDDEGRFCLFAHRNCRLRKADAWMKSGVQNRAFPDEGRRWRNAGLFEEKKLVLSKMLAKLHPSRRDVSVPRIFFTHTQLRKFSFVQSCGNFIPVSLFPKNQMRRW